MWDRIWFDQLSVDFLSMYALINYYNSPGMQKEAPIVAGRTCRLAFALSCDWLLWRCMILTGKYDCFNVSLHIIHLCWCENAECPYFWCLLQVCDLSLSHWLLSLGRSCRSVLLKSVDKTASLEECLQTSKHTRIQPVTHSTTQYPC